jgi:hypothetical protein
MIAQLPEAFTATLDGARDGVDATPELVRLFPPAYVDDPEADRLYRELMHRELFEHHRSAFDTIAATVDAAVIDEAELSGWLNALNDVRLLLGTTLGVTEDVLPVLESEDDQARFALYGYLSHLVEQLVEALSGGLPEPIESEYSPPEDPWGDPPLGLRWSAPGAPVVPGSGFAPWPGRADEDPR